MHRQHCLRVVTLGTENKLADESIQQVLKLVTLVSSVDDVAIVLIVTLSLSTQLTAKELSGICNQ